LEEFTLGVVEDSHTIKDSVDMDISTISSFQNKWRVWEGVRWFRYQQVDIILLLLVTNQSYSPGEVEFTANAAMDSL
jgi:hypothetical protein